MQKDHQPNSLYHDAFNRTEQKMFIVQLNPVDCLTLTGVLFAAISAALILEQQFSYALTVLYFAVLIDAMDGILARKFQLERPFGRYLDGFVDTLDYLLIPALFLYIWGFSGWIQSLLLVCLIACGFIRLSVFNEMGNINDEQNGLAYQGAPVFWTALALGPLYALHWLVGQYWVFALIIIALPLFSVAMLHNQQYYKFKRATTILAALLAYMTFFAIAGNIQNHPEFYQAVLADILNSIGSLPDYLLVANIAILPVICAGIMHMMIVTGNFFPRLAVPINTTRFGTTKTWRGIIIMPVFTAVSAVFIYQILYDISADMMQAFQHQPYWLTGAALGLAYSLAELPNSALKRSLGLAAGNLPQRRRWLFVVFDQLDSILGCCLVFMWLLDFNLILLTYVLIVAFVQALIIKRLLYMFGYKKTPR